jgi:hypothetical protein
MFTSALLALAGFFASAPASDSPSWLTDYPEARALGRSQQKPLAVFVGQGPRGWDEVSRDGKLGKEIRKLLALHYICVYVDANTKEGRRLAAQLELDRGLGLVLSDRTGSLQAFRHEGDLDADPLAGYLKRFADPDLVVRRTETNPPPAVRVEYYAPEQYAPVQYYGGGRSC